MQLLVELAAGKSNAAIGEAMGITASVVKIYLHRVYRILGFNSRLQAGLWANERLGILRGEDDAAC